MVFATFFLEKIEKHHWLYIFLRGPSIQGVIVAVLGGERIRV